MSLLSLSEDGESVAESGAAADGRDAGRSGGDADAVRKLSTCSASADGRTAETVAAGDRSAGDAESGSVRCRVDAATSAIPVHFKKRMLNTATGGGVEPDVIGRSPTDPRRQRSFAIHQDPVSAAAAAAAATQTPPPAKVGIVISHGRAMTLQDKLQMSATTTNSPARLSPASVARWSSTSSSSSERRLSTPVAAVARQHRRAKRRSSKPVVKRSLVPTPKVASRVLPIGAHTHTHTHTQPFFQDHTGEPVPER